MALKMPAKWKSKTSPRLIMRITLVISFLFHVVLLVSFQDAFPLYEEAENLRTYEVELIRPPVEDMDREEKGQVDMAKSKEELKLPADETEETISLDTEDKRYVDYAGMIRERLKAHWSYPPEARNRLIEGNLVVLFSLNREGVLTRLEISRSSDYEILDREAERAVRNASPFPPFPEHITAGRLNVEASFDYRITTRRKNNTEDRRQNESME
jgi:TonB family protein